MISVLTVNYRCSAEVGELAASIRRHAGDLPVELIVTNNSPEDPVGETTDDVLAVAVLPSANHGYAAGVNLAFRHSRGDLIMVANPDVRITDDTFAHAISFLRETPQAGLLLPLLRYPSGETQPSVRRFYTWPVVLFARSPLRWLGWRPGFFRRYLCEGLDRSTAGPVDWGLGAAMFLRREDCDPNGIFDEQFFIYFEDVDLCYRMWQRGRAVMYCPQVECIHAHRRHSRNPFSLSGLHHFRSLWRFVRKHGGLPQRPTAQLA